MKANICSFCNDVQCVVCSVCVDVIRANRSDTITIPFLNPACLSSPNDCLGFGDELGYMIFDVQCTAVDFVHSPHIGPKQTGSIPLLSLASASAIVWVPPRPIDSGSRDERGYALHRNDPKNTNISMTQVLHGCEFIYLCRLLCLIFDGKKHFEI